MKDLSSGMSNLADRFTRKERIIKEKSSIGGFRIPQESLKKRTNPNENRNFDELDYFNPYLNPTFNSFSFNPTKKPVNKQARNQINLSDSLVDENIPYDTNKELSGNLIDRLDREIAKLKLESEEYINHFQSNNKYNHHGKEPEEKKVYNQYLHCDSSRVQTLKHVTTQMKPEYISLEDLQRKKEEHQKKMIEIENEYYSKKRKEEADVDKLMKYSDNNLRFQAESDGKVNQSKKITPEEIASILKHEEDYLNNNKTKRIRMINRAKSARRIKRHGVSEYPLSKEEERYVKKYMNYVVKKKVSDWDSTEMNALDEEDWNKTKIKSQNVNGVVNRKDGQPGHIDREDYSFYYMSISSNTPRSLSIKSAGMSRSKSFKSKRSRVSRSKSVNTRLVVKSLKDSNIHHQNYEISEKIKKMNSHLAFIKLIYKLLDKESTGSISKNLISNEINLDQQILVDLGFESEVEFRNALIQFPTLDENSLNEEELIAFFLSRSELAEEYLENFKRNIKEADMKNENENIDINDQSDEEDLKKINFLEGDSTIERLNKLRESLNFKNSKSKTKIKEYNKSLTNKLKHKINKNEKVNIAYEDYKNFLRKYKSSADLKFTIPKPFEFFKRDYSSRKLQKIQEILEERQRKEEEIIGNKFKPNKLKREIFISQYANVIEAEREKRKYRTEKLKEKIVQEMRPFSFYENDERRHKEKLARLCEPPQFTQFKANVIPWTSQVNMYDDVVRKMEDQRRARIEERKMSLYQSAKLPPRMEMHEKRKIIQENEEKQVEKNLSSIQRSKSFKANRVPNFTKAHETFYRNLENKKSISKITKIEPFNFNEPKVNHIINYLEKSVIERVSRQGE